MLYDQSTAQVDLTTRLNNTNKYNTEGIWTNESERDNKDVSNYIPRAWTRRCQSLCAPGSWHSSRSRCPQPSTSPASPWPKTQEHPNESTKITTQDTRTSSLPRAATHQLDEVIALGVREEAAVQERPARTSKQTWHCQEANRQTGGARGARR